MGLLVDGTSPLVRRQFNQEHISLECIRNSDISIQENTFEISRLQNACHFVQASIMFNEPLMLLRKPVIDT